MEFNILRGNMEDILENETNDDVERWELTPKGIFAVALETVKLVDCFNDPRIDAAWMIFELMMEKHGYIGQRGEQNEGI